MATKTRARDKGKATLWLGCFWHTSPEGRDASFQVLVEHADPEKALDLCVERIKSLHHGPNRLFYEGGDVHLIAMFKCDRDFKEPLVLNYASHATTTPGFTLHLDVPKQPNDRIKFYGPPAPPEDATESTVMEPVATFKPLKPTRARAKATKPRSRQTGRV